MKFPPFLASKTRVGVAGWPADWQDLFKDAATQAERRQGCSVQVVFLAGVNDTHCDARLINKRSDVSRGKAAIEIELDLAGWSDQPLVRDAIIRILDQLA